MDNPNRLRHHTRSMKAGNLIGGIVLFIAAGLLLYFNLPHVLTEHRAFTAWQKADGRITGSSVHQESYRSKGRTRYRYKPRISYTFSVNGRPHSGESITPVPTDWSQSDARAVVNEHRPGRAVAVYYDPADPSRSCLLRQSIYQPYFLVTLGVAAAAFGVGVMTISHRRLVAPVRRPDSWNQLHPVATLSHALKTRTIVALILLAGIPVQAHFFLIGPGPISILAWVGGAGYLATLGVSLTVAGRAWSRSRSFGEASVMVDRLRIVPGDGVGVRMELPVQRGLLLRQVKVGLICERSVMVGTGKNRRVETTKEWEDWATLVSGHSTRSGELVRGEHTFAIPGPVPPSSPDKQPCPRWDWKLSVKIDCEPGADYEPEYPLLVLPSGG